jgi:hypothetical protein
MDNRANLRLPADHIKGLPNCGLVATAVATGMPLWHVTKTVKEASNKRANWKGRTSYGQIFAYLDGLDFLTYTEIKPHRTTLLRWVEDQPEDGVVYIVWTTGHVQAVTRTSIADQRGVFRPKDYHGKRKMVRRVVRIDLKGSASPLPGGSYSDPV